MPLGITSYVDPGVYIKEKIQPSSVSVSSDRVLAIVAIAPRTKRSEDEAVVRGKVYQETLTVDGSSPHTAYTLDVCNRVRSSTAATLYRNDQALGLGDWWFNAATIHGTEWGASTAAFGTGSYLIISIDGKKEITITISGTISGATAASTINTALNNSPIYGPTYASVASSATGAAYPIITLTSPTTDPTSSIRLYLSASNDANTILANGAWHHVHGGTASPPSGTGLPTASLGLEALTKLTVKDTVYSSSSIYKLDYISISTVTDPLAQAISTTQDLQTIVRVGSYPGADSYVNGTDYDEDAGSDVITWDTALDGQAYYIGTVDGSGGFTLGSARRIKFSLNGLTPIEVTLTTNVPSPSLANVVADINAALVLSSDYGPAYCYVASVASSKYVKLTVPKLFENWPHGQASTVTFFPPSQDDATTTIFGISSTALANTVEVSGVGKRPSFGSIYYTTYDYNRPSTDYDVVHRVYNPDQLYSYTSPITLDNYSVNKLAIAGEIAFENGASSVVLVQVNDVTVPGSPTPTQIMNAIDVAAESSVITDIVVIDTSTAIAVDLMEHVADMSSILEKKYRRGWFGMARGTDVGDSDTPDTFVYRAARTLQPGNTSPARGRLILCAPSEMSRIVTLDDGREVTLELDGSYLAVANAALNTSLLSPSDALLGKFITGFLTDSTFETYLKGERYTLASNGVNVTTLDAGRLVLTDPITTEAGGGKVIQFEEPSSSAQKDSVTRAVASVLDNNCKGIVPDDMATFLLEVKLWIAKAIRAQISAGVIAPYRNASGQSRDLDPITDIQVFQDETDPRSFIFRYWFNLKYVAKRFFGEYSVDNPFFAG